MTKHGKAMSQKSIRQKPKVGDRLFSLNVGNAARRTEQKLTPVVVVKVGTKYFYVAAEARIASSRALKQFLNSSRTWQQFHVGTWRQVTKYTPNAALYASEQEWLDEHETSSMWTSFREFFASTACSKLSLGQLRRIDGVLKEGSNPALTPLEREQVREQFHLVSSSSSNFDGLSDNHVRAIAALLKGDA